MGPGDSDDGSGRAREPEGAASTSGVTGASGASSRALLVQARAGHRSAVSRLFREALPPLRRWARGRLPLWARARADTEDLVQDAAVNTLRRVSGIEPRRRHALQAYLREAVRNRIRDEVRRAGRVEVALPADSGVAGAQPSPYARVAGLERQARYREALARLGEEEQALLVARLELGYSYEQVALATGRPTPDAARVAIRRTILKLADELERR
ncbi:MAG: sigma-70 family RNA polymerase sigma factor [Thermoanaerobaculia bacterium]|nr:sigma-70 family RNA polymerase sigma factor [Thermoanaerobaculia bacterium]